MQRVADSEDLDALTAALSAAREEPERPSFIAIRSHIAYPAPNAVDTAAAHGAPLGEEEVRAAKDAMGFDPERTFWVDERVYEHMSLLDAGAARAGRSGRSASTPGARAARAGRRLGARLDGSGLREGWREALPAFDAGDEDRHARRPGRRRWPRSRSTRRRRSAARPTWSSRPRRCSRAPASSPDAHSGRNVPFGIREHAMGAIVNGAAAHGGIVKPYGSTFLMFSDYMRGSVRLSALMGLPVVWVWTHDSVGLGEDGPTHQPVEHYAALRAIPELWVIRPADANETAQAWRVALEREDGPVALLLSRQNIPVLDREGEGLGAGERAGARRVRAVGFLASRRGRAGADPDLHRRGGRP